MSVYSYVIFCTVLTMPLFGQSYQLRDKQGVPIITLEDVQLFRYSSYFKEDVPAFQALMKNVSGLPLFSISISALVHKKDQSTAKFMVCGPGESFDGLTLAANVPQQVTHAFLKPFPFAKEEVASIEFVLETGQRPITEDGFRVSGFIAKDEGCFRDFLTTKSLAGLALRKKMQDLVQYGCGFVLDSPMAALMLDKTKRAFTIETNKIVGVQVVVIDEQVFLGNDPRPHNLESGWVPFKSLMPAKILNSENIGISKKGPAIERK